MELTNIPSQSGSRSSYKWTLTPEEEQEAIDSWVKAREAHNKWKRKAMPQALLDPVDPTPEQRDEILRMANELKGWRAKQEELMRASKARTMAEARNLRAEWDAARFFKLMKQRAADDGTKLITEGEPLKLVKMLCLYFGNDPRFETELGMDREKGVALSGKPGLGKSWLVRLIADNPVCPVQIITMAEVIDAVREKGEFTGTNFGDYQIVYLDDVGTEGDNVVKHFGTEVNWFKTFIEEYYAKNRGYYHRLWFSTNDSGDELQRKYGFRVRDRLREMFNVFNVSGVSLRK